MTADELAERFNLSLAIDHYREFGHRTKLRALGADIDELGIPRFRGRPRVPLRPLEVVHLVWNAQLIKGERFTRANDESCDAFAYVAARQGYCVEKIMALFRKVPAERRFAIRRDLFQVFTEEGCLHPDYLTGRKKLRN